MNIFIMFFDNLENLKKDEIFLKFFNDKENFYYTYENYSELIQNKKELTNKVIYSSNDSMISLKEIFPELTFNLKKKVYHPIYVRTENPSILDNICSNYILPTTKQFYKNCMICSLNDLWEELDLLKKLSYYDYQKLKLKETLPSLMQYVKSYNQEMERKQGEIINNEKV